MKKYLSFLFIFTSLVLPIFFVAAQEYKEPEPSGLVSGCNRGEPVRTDVKDSTGKVISSETTFANTCGFNDLMAMANRLINFVLFFLATPLVALGICYAGFLYLFSGGSSEKVGQAKNILQNLVIGYIVACLAWIAVKTIMVSLGFDSTGIFLQV